MSKLYHNSGENASGNCVEQECIIAPSESAARSHLTDQALSLKAKGLLAYMLLQPPGWDYTIQGLSMNNRDGVDSVRAAMRELIDAGYVVRTKLKDEHGRYTGNQYLIHEERPKGGAAFHG